MIMRNASIAIFAIIGFSVGKTHGVTADQLANYIGVKTWDSKVSLPGQSFRVGIFEINKGKVGNPISVGNSGDNSKPDEGFIVMVGIENKKYKIVISYPSGFGPTVDIHTQIAAFEETVGYPLPKTLTSGDYLLFGVPKHDRNTHSKIEDFDRGFLLRIEPVTENKKG